MTANAIREGLRLFDAEVRKARDRAFELCINLGFDLAVAEEYLVQFDAAVAVERVRLHQQMLWDDE